MRHFRRLSLFLLALLAGGFLAMPAQTSAQTLTTVTGTITDVNGIPYSGARMSIALNSPGGPSPNLTPCPGHNGCLVSSPGLISLSPTGTYTINLWANASILPAATTYSFLISTPGTPLPLGTGPQVCSLTAVTIAGATQTLSSSSCPALSNIGGGTGSATGNVGAAINVKSAPFNAVGDAQQLQDGAWTTTTTLTSATANFKATDVGKLIWCNNNSTGTNSWAPTTIASFTNSTTVALSALPVSNNLSGQTCVWYTADDTAAINAAYAAAAVTGGNNTFLSQYVVPAARKVYLPPGGYVTSSPTFQMLAIGQNAEGVSLLGDSEGTSTIFPSPAFNFTGLGGNRGFVISAFATGNRFSDFTINGSGFVFSNVGNNPVAEFSCSSCVIDHVAVYNIGLATPAGMFTFDGNEKIYSILAQNAPTPTTNQTIACQFASASAAFMYASICSNATYNLSVQGEVGATLGQSVTLVGNLFDECGVPPCTRITTSLDTNFVGDVVWGSGGGYAMSIDGTSVVRMSQSFVGPYNPSGNTGGGVTLASGGKLIATGSQFVYSGAAGNDNAVNGAAGSVFIDDGGNQYCNSASGSCVAVTQATYSTHGFTGGIIPKASVTHTPNTCYAGTLVAATAQNLCTVLLDQNYQVLNITAQSGGAAPVNSSCTTAPVVTMSDGTNSATLTLTTGATTWSTTGLSTVFAQGNTLTVSVSTFTCVTPPVNLSVNYVLQSVLNP